LSIGDRLSESSSAAADRSDFSDTSKMHFNPNGKKKPRLLCHVFDLDQTTAVSSISINRHFLDACKGWHQGQRRSWKPKFCWGAMYRKELRPFSNSGIGHVCNCQSKCPQPLRGHMN
jgi:hypothetical protein